MACCPSPPAQRCGAVKLRHARYGPGVRASQRGDGAPRTPHRVPANRPQLATRTYGNANTANNPMWSLANKTVPSARFAATSPSAPVSAGHHRAVSR